MKKRHAFNGSARKNGNTTYRLPNENLEEPSTRLKAPDKKSLLQSNYTEDIQTVKSVTKY